MWDFNQSSIFFTAQPVEAIYLLQKNKKTLWLGVLTILKNMSSSMGRIIPYIMDRKIHVPNQQPATYPLVI
jgi:hypothetical protein